MTVGYAPDLRDAQQDALTAFIGNGGLLRIYDGARPATGGAITSQTLLAELTLGSPFAGASIDGQLIGYPVTSDASADATGQATWFRIVKANGTTFCIDGDAGDLLSSADLRLADDNLVLGGEVVVNVISIYRGNA